MKLTNQQINALIPEFSKSDSIKKENAIAVEKMKRNKSVIELAKRIKRSIDLMPSEYKGSYLSYEARRSTLNQIISNIAEGKAPKKKYLTDSDIKNKIIIASIDSKDLAELKRKIKL